MVEIGSTYRLLAASESPHFDFTTYPSIDMEGTYLPYQLRLLSAARLSYPALSCPALLALSVSHSNSVDPGATYHYHTRSRSALQHTNSPLTTTRDLKTLPTHNRTHTELRLSSGHFFPPSTSLTSLAQPHNFGATNFLALPHPELDPLLPVIADPTSLRDRRLSPAHFPCDSDTPLPLDLLAHARLALKKFLLFGNLTISTYASDYDLTDQTSSQTR
ncbi:uncharacterized protein CLUP02_10751 [Colletotrichum lupini]|uniref:Uncharacterized protein n=1 Tax=Colletotrichum lupini TaxID=145971 RepID=A0A9Q8WJ29_9PEZI|nr:uncharacterized protein CLUP02_10751 [Colletotrichum lupini]UQC85254.1 hypothetical protein CLUP02_10751 [Colletotrichum lupini]